MNTRTTTSTSILACALLAAAAHAQSNVSPVNKFSWSENCGWMNWRDAGSPTGAQGVRFGPTCLSGFIWAENIGFINLGDGTPADNSGYANSDGGNFGVNRDPATGSLSGMAWGENVGWINFSLPLLDPGQRPRVDDAAHRLRGFAWGENIGWINLDDPAAFVSLRLCPADINDSGQVSVQDIFDFLVAYFAADSRADFNGNGSVTVQDIFDFLAAYFAGCD